MIALEVALNGEKLTTAGAEDLCVLSGIVTASGNLGKLTKRPPHGGTDLYLQVGGLTSRAEGLKKENLVWVEQRKVKPGDEISIKLIQANNANPPVPSIFGDLE